MTKAKVKAELKKHINSEKAAFYPRFFKTGVGEYGEGDKFLGVVVPDQRRIANQFRDLPLSEIKKLLDDPFHECRLTGLYILVQQFDKAKAGSEQKTIYDFYLENLDRVNNWDLVDSSAHKIVGPYLFERSRKPLYRLAKSNHLWRQRVAIISTLFFIKNADFADTFELSDALLNHKHDLIHKAVGWMLRELGKVDENALVAFLQTRYKAMPRTMLRYTIEKFSPERRQQYLAGTV